MSVESWCCHRLVITVDGPEGRRLAVIDKPFARVGSDPRAEVVLPRAALPACALFVLATGEGISCLNLLHPRGEPSSVAGRPASDRVVALGPYRLSVQLADTDATWLGFSPDLEAIGSVPPPQPVVALSVDGREVARRPIRRRLTLIGSQKPSTLRVTSDQVAPCHAVVYHQASRLWLIDLLGGCPTRVDDRPVEAAEFRWGQTVLLGPAELTFHPARRAGGPLGPSESDNDDPLDFQRTAFCDRFAPGSRNFGNEEDVAGDAGPAESGEAIESLALAARLADQRQSLEADRSRFADLQQQREAELSDARRRLAEVEQECRRREQQLARQAGEIERLRAARSSAQQAAEREVEAWLPPRQQSEARRRLFDELQCRLAEFLDDPQRPRQRSRADDEERESDRRRLLERIRYLEGRITQLETAADASVAQSKSWQAIG